VVALFLRLNDYSQPSGHRLHQLFEVVAIAHPGHPELDDLSLPLLHVGAGGLPELELHPGPHLLWG
jgi:hypothetical protein